MKEFLAVTGIVIIAFSLIPLIRHDFWAFRVFEYPRLQKLFLNLVVIILYVFLVGWQTTGDLFFLVATGSNALYLIYQIYPFTFFAKKQLLKTRSEIPANGIKIISSNVLQYNRNTKGCLNVINKYNPDIVLLLETDQFWCDETASLKKDYPFQVLVPQENTYGMLLYSKLELLNTQQRFIVDEEIPSITTEIKLKSGKIILFNCLHPTPPVPQENPFSTERDKELLIVAKEVKNQDLPAIVVGDLNDVAWSYTTELFAKTSGLLDPRIGRGFYNTFHAQYPFLRFPLDHIFCSTDFKLVALKRIENFDSDHFPIFVHLQYEPNADLEQEEPVADEEEKKLAQEKINKELPDAVN